MRRPSKTKGRTKKALRFPWSPGIRLAYKLAAHKIASFDGFWPTTTRGTPYTEDRLRTMWSRARDRALKERPSLTFHDLRAKAGTDGDDWHLLGHLDQKTHSHAYDRKPRTVKPAR